MNIDKIITRLGLQKAKLRGDELSASCPFAKDTHTKGHDHSPSWSLNLDRLVYNCFTCGERGTLEDLVEYILDVDTPHALDVIIGEFDIDPLEHKFETVAKPKRVVAPTMYFPEGRLAEFDKVDAPYELYVGIVENVYDESIECKIYPVRDRKGRLVGAVARSLKGRFHQNMWGFTKSNFLLGEQDIVEGERVCIVEGPGDMGAMKEAGVHNVVALMGSKPSKVQTHKLVTLSDSFLVWPDKDEAGNSVLTWAINDLERVADEVLYVNPYTQLLEDENDPKDVFLKRGSNGIFEVMGNAKTSLLHEATQTGVLDKCPPNC